MVVVEKLTTLSAVKLQS